MSDMEANRSAWRIRGRLVVVALTLAGGLGLFVVRPYLVVEARRNRARAQLDRLRSGLVSYYSAEHAARSGYILPKQFPRVSTEANAWMTCEGAVSNGPSSWAHPDWRMLGLRADEEPSYFTFRLRSWGIGCSSGFELTATGRPDCGAEVETYFRRAQLVCEPVISEPGCRSQLE